MILLKDSARLTRIYLRRTPEPLLGGAKGPDGRVAGHEAFGLGGAHRCRVARSQAPVAPERRAWDALLGMGNLKKRAGMAKKGSGWEPAGEKHPHDGGGAGGLAGQPTSACFLCNRLRQLRKPKGGFPVAAGAPQRLRLALVDGDGGVRATAGQMARERQDWTLNLYHPCGAGTEPSSPGEAARGNGPQAPHVILVSLCDPGPSRLACVRKLKALAPDLPVLVIRRHWDARAIAECCAAGADGYLVKPITREELARASSQAATGHPVLCAEAQAAAVDCLRRLGAAHQCQTLSAREREVMRCVMREIPDKDAATALGIADATLHRHLSNIYKKLGVHRKADALRKFVGEGGVSSCSQTSIWSLHHFCTFCTFACPLDVWSNSSIAMVCTDAIVRGGRGLRRQSVPEAPGWCAAE